jgi:hypothetical protein
VTSRQMSLAEFLNLPPVMSLAQLARVLDVSEPTIRQLYRSGELADRGIEVDRLGAQFRVKTATVRSYLGLGGDSGSSTVQQARGDAGKSRPVASRMSKGAAGVRVSTDLVQC